MEKNADEIQSLMNYLFNLDEELKGMQASLKFSEEDALKFTFHKLFAEAAFFYYSILIQFKNGHFDSLGENQPELYRYKRIFKHLAE